MSSHIIHRYCPICYKDMTFFISSINNCSCVTDLEIIKLFPWERDKINFMHKQRDLYLKKQKRLEKLKRICK